MFDRNATAGYRRGVPAVHTEHCVAAYARACVNACEFCSDRVLRLMFAARRKCNAMPWRTTLERLSARQEHTNGYEFMLPHVSVIYISRLDTLLLLLGRIMT